MIMLDDRSAYLLAVQNRANAVNEALEDVSEAESMLRHVLERWAGSRMYTAVMVAIDNYVEAKIHERLVREADPFAKPRSAKPRNAKA